MGNDFHISFVFPRTIIVYKLIPRYDLKKFITFYIMEQKKKKNQINVELMLPN